jgi:hypothetical protein
MKIRSYVDRLFSMLDILACTALVITTPSVGMFSRATVHSHKLGVVASISLWFQPFHEPREFRL